MSVAADANAIYVAEVGAARVVVLDLAGRELAALGGYGRGPGQMLAPRCVRVDARGHVFVLDRVAACVHELDAAHRSVARHAIAPGSAVDWLARDTDGAVSWA